MSLDYTTIHLCNALLNLSYGGMLLALWYRRRETHLLLWAASLLLVAAAVYGFTLTRNTIAIALLLAAVSTNISLTWAGARSLDNRAPFHRALAVAPVATFVGHIILVSMGARVGANVFATALLAANIAVTGRYFLTGGSGFARKAVGWVLIAYAPVYVASLVLEFAYPDSRISSILILVSDFVLNNAFVVGLFAIMEEKARDELRRLAVTDQLTGALNRVGLLGKFPDGRILNARSLLLADLDHFKAINDTFGHTGGDQALRTFVARASEFLEKDEFIARIGGEEFGIVLSTSDIQSASARAEEIRNRLAGEPVVWKGKPMVVTTSIGVAVCTGSDDFETIMSRADDALYRAKRGGRNRVAA